MPEHLLRGRYGASFAFHSFCFQRREHTVPWVRPLVGVDVEVKREIAALPGIETYPYSQYTVSVLFVSRSVLYTLSYSTEIWSIRIWTLFKFLKPQKIGDAYLFSASRFPKEHCFLKVVRLCPFVLITAACKWRWAWSTGGTILKGENPGTQRNSVPMPLFPPKISHGIAQDRTGLGY